MTMRKILFLSHTFYGSTFRVGSHHLSETGASQGDIVYHVSTPISKLQTWRKRGSTETQQRWKMADSENRIDGVQTFIPKTNLPTSVNFVVRLFLPFLFNRKSKIEKLIENKLFDFIIVDQPYFYHYVRDIPKDTLLILRITDLPKTFLSRLATRLLLARSAALITTHQNIVKEIGVTNKPTLVVTNGVDLERFNSNYQSQLPRSGAVYVGAFDSRIDSEFFKFLIDQKIVPFIHIYSTSVDYKQLPEGVSFIGKAPYDELPRILSCYEFGLLPFSKSKLNSARSPMKLFEYVSTGLVILATDYDLTLPSMVGNLRMFSKTDLPTSYDEIYTSTNDTELSYKERESWDIKYRIITQFLDEMRNDK